MENKEMVLLKGEMKVFSVSLSVEEEKDVTVKAYSDVQVCCISSKGKDYLGNDFEKSVHLQANTPKDIWFCIQIPEDYNKAQAEIDIKVLDGDETVYSSCIKISVKDGGVFEGNPFTNKDNLNRLAWLNSTIGIDRNVPSPYTNISVSGNDAEILGHKIRFNEKGLLGSVQSYFSQDVTIGDDVTELLSEELEFCVFGQEFVIKDKAQSVSDDKYTLSVTSESKDFVLKTSGLLEYDGYMLYKLELTPKTDIKSSVELRLPVSEECRRYFIGLGKATRSAGYFKTSEMI